MKVAAPVVLCGLLACSYSPPLMPSACPSVGRHAMAVILVTGDTRVAAAFSNVNVTITSPAFSDSAQRPSISPDDVVMKRNSIDLARGHGGTYRVTVRADGFNTFVHPSFTTERNLACRAQTDTLIASMQ